MKEKWNLSKTNKNTLTLIFLMVFSAQLFSQQNISDTLVTERLQTIEQILNRGKPSANAWWYGWVIGYSAATVGQGAVMAMSEKLGTRQDMALGSITTILGAANILITPRDPAIATDKLAQIPENTPEERSIKLLEAEKLLKRSADVERAGRNWQEQAICGIVNVSSGLITWFGFHRNAMAGLENFLINTAISEAQIYTQPTRAMKDYNAYLNKYTSIQSSFSKTTNLKLLVYAVPGGVGVKFVF